MTIPTIPDGLHTVEPPELRWQTANKTNLVLHAVQLADLFKLETSRKRKMYEHSPASYCLLPGEYPLRGLPGCVNTEEGFIVTVKPFAWWRNLLEARCLDGVIDHFRCIRSAELMAKGLLPVYCADGYGNSFLVAYVPYSEHDRFNR